MARFSWWSNSAAHMLLELGMTPDDPILRQVADMFFAI